MVEGGRAIGLGALLWARRSGGRGHNHLREHRVDDGALRLLGRLRRVERRRPLQHVLLVVGGEQPRVEGALDEEGVLLGRVRRLGARLHGDESECLAEHGAVRVGKVHQDAVGEEDEPVVLELRLLLGSRVGRGELLLEQPAVRDVGHLLLQHDDLLQPQVPQLDVREDGRLDLEHLVRRLDLEHLLAAVLEQVERLRDARLDLARVLRRRELLELDVAVGEEAEREWLPQAVWHFHLDLRVEHVGDGAAADREAQRERALDDHLRHLLDGLAHDALDGADDVALDERALAVGGPAVGDGADGHLAVPQVDGDAERAADHVADDGDVEELLLVRVRLARHALVPVLLLALGRRRRDRAGERVRHAARHLAAVGLGHRLARLVRVHAGGAVGVLEVALARLLLPALLLLPLLRLLERLLRLRLPSSRQQGEECVGGAWVSYEGGWEGGGVERRGIGVAEGGVRGEGGGASSPAPPPPSSSRRPRAPPPPSWRARAPQPSPSPAPP